MLHRSLVAVTDIMATSPGVIFCVKAIDGRYLSVNQAFADRAGVRRPGDVIGKTAQDLFPKELADRYDAQDRQILLTGHMLTNELELITRADGTIGWFVTSKSRWTDGRGRPAGLVALSVDLHAPVTSDSPYRHLHTAITHAREHFREQLSVHDLATAADMTVPQLERASTRTLGLSPKKLLMRFRIEEALRLLETTNDSFTDIAVSCGYYDQSQFNRHFRSVVGYSPSSWRTRVVRALDLAATDR